MPDPIRIEKAFQEAAEAIQTAQSFRYIFHLFFSFTNLLDGEYLKYQSYLRQLADDLPLYTLPVTWSGLDPEKLQQDAELLEKISSEIKTDTCDEVIRRIKEISFLQYICISEPEKADLQFESLTGSRLLGGNVEEVKGTTCSSLSYVEEELKSFSEQQGLSQPERRTVNRLVQDTCRMLSREGNTMLIPVVEEAAQGIEGNFEERSGRLRRISLRDSGKNPDKDTIIRHYPVMGAEPVSSVERPAITSWGREKAEDKCPVLKQNFFNATLHYDINEASHQGESGSMAVSAMWYTFLLEKADQREKYVLAGDVAMTGDVDVRGNVLPVDPSGIESKTEAAFFSWANLLAVPAQQLQEFDTYLKKLKLKYPGRSLTLIGIENLDSIFYDRRLSRFVVESRISHVIKKLKKEKFSIVGLPVIAVLLLIIARLIYGPVDQNPVAAEFYGNQLLLKNISGTVVTEIEVSEQTVRYGNTQLHLRSPIVQLHDINKDGINEVIYSNMLGRFTTDEPYVRAWSVSGDSLIWEKEIIFNYRYPGQSAYLNTSLKVSEIQILKTDEGDKVAVFADARRYFHSAVYVMDITDGEIEQEFVHPGRIRDLHVADIDSDSSDEIICLAVNNAYWKASIAVLEYVEGEKGYAPATDGYIPEGLKPAEMLHYILIPKTLIADFFEPISKYNQGENINFDPLTDHFNFGIIEGLTSVHEYEQNMMVYYHFNKQFEPVGIGTSDTFDVAVRDFFRDGKTSFIPDYEYFDTLQDSIQYWNGERFVYTQEYFNQLSE